jgi:molybdopterin molybdotransferase
MRLTPPALALALATARTRVRVRRRPRVAVLSGGSELAAPGEEPGPGRIRASNPWLLASALERAGAQVVSLEIVSDSEEEQRRAVQRALEADLLLTSGGTGRGRADRIRQVLEGCGVEILFRGVAIEPGRPVLGGRRGATLVFGLPGTPVAVWVLWRVLVEPCLRRLEGEAVWRPHLERARLASPVDHPPGVEFWIPADLSHAGSERVVRPRGPGRGAALRAHLGASALVRLDPAASPRTPAGAEVEFLE